MDDNQEDEAVQNDAYGIISEIKSTEAIRPLSQTPSTIRNLTSAEPDKSEPSKYEPPSTANQAPEISISQRQLTRRRFSCASIAEQKYKKAILEAAAELAHSFSEHYWPEVLQDGEQHTDQVRSSPPSRESTRKGFLFYLNASGRYLVLREHLRTAVSSLVQQKCLNMRPTGFQNHRDFQAFLHDIYVYLVDKMNEILNQAKFQETDPLQSNLDRLLQQTNCGSDQELSKDSLHKRQITDLGIFAEESFTQGDFEGCHKVHLQRISRDKESARTWTEFATMWLSKGDDRMAEVSVREALSKDPQHVHALLILGVLSVRHGRQKGLEYIGAALALKPMSPEVLVIAGLANNLLENDAVSEQFFRKAAFIHRLVTGQSTRDLEKLFEGNKPFNMKEFVTNLDGMDKSRSATAVSRVKTGQMVDATTSYALIAQQSLQAQAQAQAQNDSRQQIGRESAPRKSRDDGRLPRPSNTKSKRSTNSMGKMEASLLLLDKGPQGQPGPMFQESLEDIQLEQMEIPPLCNSIQSPWDVTEYSEKMERYLQTVEFLASPSTPALKKNKNVPSNKIPNDDGVATDDKIKEEYDKMAGRKSSETTVGTFKTSTGSASTRRSSAFTERERGQGESRQSKSANKSEADATEPSASPETAKLTNRLGTELIWAAQLLLNLRLFDFADGALSKQLFFYGKRTIQFMYLRALSLHLRQRDDEALQVIKEAIELDNANGIYWALEGHCYYSLGNTAEAMNSYEKALRVPHINENRHLLYLQYGSLILEEGKTKLAKRVFLHGVTKYPTPYMWLALGSSCYHRKEYDQAESAFSEANRLDHTNPIPWGHLSLSSLMQDKRALAEQAYKWAVRFGLKKGPLMDEISRLQDIKGYGDPSFPRVPTCIPHTYYLRRLGKTKPFNMYKEGLHQERPKLNKDRYADTEREVLLKQKLEHTLGNRPGHPLEEEWPGEDYHQQPYFGEIDRDGVTTVRSQLSANKSKEQVTMPYEKESPPDLVGVKEPPQSRHKQKSQAQN